MHVRIFNYKSIAFFVVVSLFSFFELTPNLPGIGFLLSFLLVFRYITFDTKSLIFFALFSSSNILIVLQGQCRDSVLKSFISLCLILLFIIAIKNFSKLIVQDGNERDERVLNLTFGTILVANLTSILIEKLIFSSQRPSGIFFSEPSHASLLIVPIMFLFVIQGKVFLSLIGVVSLALAYSSTGVAAFAAMVSLLFAPIFLRLLQRLRISSYHLSFIIFGILIGLFFITNAQTLERMEGVLSGDNSSQDSNLSSLVYLNGWLLAFGYLKQTFYLGIGFNLMGCEGGLPTSLSQIITNISGAYLNFNDGSFLISKFVSELGVFFLPILLVASHRFVKMVSFLFHKIRNKESFGYHKKLAIALYLSGFFFLFIRGAGYFSLPFLYVIIGYYLWSDDNKI